MRILLLCLLLLLTANCNPVTAPSDAEQGAISCANYCEEITNACTGNTRQYASKTLCRAYCSTFADLPAGSEGEQSGNTVACRTYHAIVASASNPALHCPHAGKSGANVCGNWCDNYCHLMELNCDVPLDQCANDCDAIPDTGTPGDQDGDTIQCRIHYAGLAGAEAITQEAFCAGASPISPECN